MKEGLELLYILQQQDDRIRNTEDLIREIPLEIQKLENQRDSKEEIVKISRQKLDENKTQREKYEKEIQRTKEVITKKKEQLNKATTNREYQGLNNEIKYEEGLISSIEEKIIEKMLESDEILEEIRESESEYRKISEEFNKKISDYQTNLKYQQGKLIEENDSKSKLKAKIPENLLKIYENLFKKKAGKAISYVETDFCGACNVKIRPQLLSEIISTSNILVCENCGRILFKKIEEEEVDGKTKQ